VAAPLFDEAKGVPSKNVIDELLQRRFVAIMRSSDLNGFMLGTSKTVRKAKLSVRSCKNREHRTSTERAYCLYRAFSIIALREEEAGEGIL
jgi:hypothetical protein